MLVLRRIFRMLFADIRGNETRVSALVRQLLDLMRPCGTSITHSQFVEAMTFEFVELNRESALPRPTKVENCAPALLRLLSSRKQQNSSSGRPAL
jgi:hypothetical protein